MQYTVLKMNWLNLSETHMLPKSNLISVNESVEIALKFGRKWASLRYGTLKLGDKEHFDKEHLALRNNFRVTKIFLIT